MGSSTIDDRCFGAGHVELDGVRRSSSGGAGDFHVEASLVRGRRAGKLPVPHVMVRARGARELQVTGAEKVGASSIRAPFAAS
jgi:hypothetical protein